MAHAQPNTPNRPPSVERLLHALGPDAVERYGRAAVTEAVRAALDTARADWRESGVPPGEPELLTAVHAILEAGERPSLGPVINATGVVLHTGLGRAVLPRRAVEAALAVHTGHSLLEVDPETGARGARHTHVLDHLRALTGAEDAFVVNNNAGAVLLALAAIAAGGEVIVSRGELVEIGGGFRVPEVMAQSGATLVEVGTTNKTRAQDYERAITPNTAALLKVHPSNYRVVGFAESATLPELAEIARRRAIPLLDDLGSGSLIDLRRYGIGDEPTAMERLEQGADLVMFSGDKLLGGPQAGILAGRADLMARIRAHPLARALRCDKVTISLLEQTLALYRQGRATEEIPTLRALTRSPDEVRASAEHLALALNALPGVSAETVETVARAGAGSLPEEAIPSWAVAVAVEGLPPMAFADALRRHQPPVFARVSDDRLLLEARTLLPGEDAILAGAVAAIARSRPKTPPAPG